MSKNVGVGKPSSFRSTKGSSNLAGSWHVIKQAGFASVWYTSGVSRSLPSQLVLEGVETKLKMGLNCADG